ncbi:MAG: valine--tRNA ligase [Planctomycetes bacterium]|nr:valine--tRNA ligase [Planctomycetota bacterium]
MPEPLSPRYEPATIEGRIYQLWESSGAFAPNSARARGAKPFVVTIPPPNVTGALHMGHALNQTFQDISIRFERMRGRAALWVPGTDHAGIATQNVVEKELKKQGRRRQELGREGFVQEVWKWKDQYEKRICTQMRALGQSLDWSRYAFTMDPRRSAAVRKAFCTLWERDLVYRGKRIVNWCPRCMTALSDEEAEKHASKGNLWKFKYPVKGMPGQFVTIATTRPETMLGDVAVAVNPKDERYKDLVGKTLILPLVGREIPVITDEAVEREFGTGAVKVTPAHDQTDYEIGERHGCERTVIMNPEGAIALDSIKAYIGKTDFALATLEGVDRFEARKRIVEAMKERELLAGVDDHENAVGRCYRCDTIVEPYLSDQWFVRMSVLAKKAADAQRRGEIKFHPERWESFYLSWLDNARDWCVSRQIWWGHRVPVWWCENKHITVPPATNATTDPLQCATCGSKNIEQDNDVFDTWMSSWLWPFEVLGWPEKTSDLENYYPTDLLVTDRGIIFLWVARMVMAGLEFMDKIPFHHVYINGTVLDAQGRKMSKSLGNGIDPIDMIKEYGADAVRYSLAILSSEGQDLKLAKEKFIQGRNFCNKVWNAARFIGMNLEGAPRADAAKATRLEDRFIRSRASSAIDNITKALDNFKYNDAAQELYRFIWNDFCDHYLESVKGRLGAEAETADREMARAVLLETLQTIVKLLHPYVPFLTEEIYQSMLVPVLMNPAPTLMESAWPAPRPEAREAAAERETEIVRDALRAVRNLRAVFNYPIGANPDNAVFSANSTNAAKVVRENIILIRDLGRLGEAQVGVDLPRPRRSGVDVFDGGVFYLPLEGQVDVAAGVDQLKKKIDKVESGIKGIDAKLSNESFISRADSEIVAGERARRGDLEREIAMLRRNLEGLES